MPNSVLNDQIPNERSYKRNSMLTHLRVIGCLCFAKSLTETDKLKPKAKMYALLGYLETQKAETTLIDIEYHEHDHDESEHNVLDIPQTIENPTHTLVQQEIPPINPSVQEPWKSSRGKQPPVWMKYFISLNVHKDILYHIANYISYDHISFTYQAYIVVTSCLTEPVSFGEESKDPRWMDAMKTEIDTLENNNIWEVFTLPQGKNILVANRFTKLNIKLQEKLKDLTLA
ncbi:uncharacterized protein LOC132611574 [Lycium barbarum]|uniref:uncharacterized protein LOC132611574 n=1 Tax=Lycium barbarum TaxID=112863 RepID=UPI00293E9454|nr:uncharacterized protein LOC132611574 [Lycium barbarum]